MLNKNHYYFTNPKYSTNHLCIPMGDNSFGVFEKMVIGKDKKGRSINLPWWRMIFATPLARGVDASSAIESAVELGIKPYDIEVVGGVQQ